MGLSMTKQNCERWRKDDGASDANFFQSAQILSELEESRKKCSVRLAGRMGYSVFSRSMEKL